MTSTTVPSPDEMSDSQRRLIMSLALNDIQVKVNKHHEILITGNGEVSLLERMRNIEKFVSGFQYWGRVLVGAIIVQIIIFIGGLVVALVRFLPVLERLAGQS